MPHAASPCLRPTRLPGSMTRRELTDYYAERSGFDTSNALFYYAFGLFKVAVIVQQIYYRYVQGFTKDERFAQLNRQVAALSEEAYRAVKRGRIRILSKANAASDSWRIRRGTVACWIPAVAGLLADFRSWSRRWSRGATWMPTGTSNRRRDLSVYRACPGLRCFDELGLFENAARDLRRADPGRKPIAGFAVHRSIPTRFIVRGFWRSRGPVHDAVDHREPRQKSGGCRRPAAGRRVRLSESSQDPAAGSDSPADRPDGANSKDLVCRKVVILVAKKM